MKLLCSVYALVLLIINCAPGQKQQFRHIQKGEFNASLTLTGELQAVNSNVIIMPRLGWSYGRPKIAKLVAEGTEVKKGAFVVQVDTTEIIRFIDKKNKELEIAKAELRIMQVNNNNSMQGLNSQLAKAETSYS